MRSTLSAMMGRRISAKRGPSPVVASAARTLLNKSDNGGRACSRPLCRFLGLYRDPGRVAEVTAGATGASATSSAASSRRRSTSSLCRRPDINRIRPDRVAALNQIGRRLTEDLQERSAASACC